MNLPLKLVKMQRSQALRLKSNPIYLIRHAIPHCYGRGPPGHHGFGPLNSRTIDRLSSVHSEGKYCTLLSESRLQSAINLFSSFIDAYQLQQCDREGKKIGKLLLDAQIKPWVPPPFFVSACSIATSFFLKCT